MDTGGGLVFSTHCKGWGGWVFEIGDVSHPNAADGNQVIILIVIVIIIALLPLFEFLKIAPRNAI